MEKIKLLISAKSIPVHRKDILNGTYVDTHENNRSCDFRLGEEDGPRKQADTRKLEELDTKI